MVTKYGFSIIGPLSLEDGGEISIGDGFVRNKSIIADNTYSRIDNEIINISKISLNNAINIISKNRVLLEKLLLSNKYKFNHCFWTNGKSTTNKIIMDSLNRLNFIIKEKCFI